MKVLAINSSARKDGNTAVLINTVSVAQVILRWDLQNGVVVIPGSSNPKHILENTNLYSFKLTDQEMEQIKALNRNEKQLQRTSSI